MTRPLAPWSENLTVPSTFANSVSSLPRPYVEARAEAATALAHENRSAGDDVAVEPLDAEALRVAVAAVT
jgi:hypothetical protein